MKILSILFFSTIFPVMDTNSTVDLHWEHVQQFLQILMWMPISTLGKLMHTSEYYLLQNSNFLNRIRRIVCLNDCSSLFGPYYTVQQWFQVAQA